MAAMVTPTQTSDGARVAQFSMAANLHWVCWVELGQFPYLNQTVPLTGERQSTIIGIFKGFFFAALKDPRL